MNRYETHGDVAPIPEGLIATGTALDGETPMYKSAFSADRHCVEVGNREDGTVIVRNSRDPEREIEYTEPEWNAFIGGVMQGHFGEPFIEFADPES